MKRFSLADMRTWTGLCYDPSKYLPEDWQGTVIDILDHGCGCPMKDRIWLVWCSHSVDYGVMDQWRQWSQAKALEYWAKPDFQFKEKLPANLDEKARRSQVTWFEIDGVWDFVGRTEQVAKLKELILAKEQTP